MPPDRGPCRVVYAVAVAVAVAWIALLVLLVTVGDAPVRQMFIGMAW